LIYKLYIFLKMLCVYVQIAAGSIRKPVCLSLFILIVVDKRIYKILSGKKK